MYIFENFFHLKNMILHVTLMKKSFIETSMIVVQYDNDSSDDDIKLIFSFIVDFNANVTFEYLLLNAL